MDSAYDRKFEEMKKYIPFLENMIQRLENSGLSSNPRQAQLDKIRSLRDLLLDKKKRMKMENLLKCEQVLINLYAKVEQRGMDPGKVENKNSSEKEKTELNAVRKKLKSLGVPKVNEIDNSETLPEIARASKTEEVCVPGSKEPALFQRRPNKPVNSQTPSIITQPAPLITNVKEPSPQSLIKNYTRVLHSPEPSESRWSDVGPSTSSDNALFCRRSPKSPRRQSPSYSKKERKKSKQKGKHEDMEKAGREDPLDPNKLNITLKVPEERLLSLNTQDILSRILNCSDSDVDIDTLRGLRSQILGELKQTGSKDDITDLILKSYKKKTRVPKKNTEMEEGELSDSDSEAIKNIYGSLVVMNKDKSKVNLVSNTSEKDGSRKIQICLVINSQQAESNTETNKSEPVNFSKVDAADFENYHPKPEVRTSNIEDEVISLIEESKTKINMSKENVVSQVESDQKRDKNNKDLDSLPVPKLSHQDMNSSQSPKVLEKPPTQKTVENLSEQKTEQKTKEKVSEQNTSEKLPNQINFYKPIDECDTEKDNSKRSTIVPKRETKAVSKTDENLEIKPEVTEKSVNIPLLNFEETTKKDVVSEIDILQALKNEILSETSSALNTDTEPPPLHQPKLLKVVNMPVGNKKRISIEKYKAKSLNSPRSSHKDVDLTCKDDLYKKPSIKLTEKECERFSFLSKLTLHDSSDEEEKSSMSLDDIYDIDLAPKSPDNEDYCDSSTKPPVIIPNDPIEKEVVAVSSDIDMRKLMPAPPMQSSTICNSSLSKPVNIEGPQDYLRTEDKIINNLPLTDPRIKRDVILKPDPSNSLDIASQELRNFGGSSTPQHIASHQNIIPNLNPYIPPSVTPVIPPLMVPPVVAPNMTPSMSQNLTHNLIAMSPLLTPNARTYEMTPTHVSPLEKEDFSRNQHVYTPMFSNFESNDNEKFNERKPPVWENDRWRNDNLRKPEKRIPVWEERYDSYQSRNRNDRYHYDLQESYNRSDCPPTPTPSFGRLEMPTTPIHPFGRSDCTPRPDSALSMSNQYGRSDYINRSSQNPFGPNTDSRRGRKYDYNNREDDRERRYYNERTQYRQNQSNRSFNDVDSTLRYNREQSVGRGDRSTSNDRRDRETSHYREPSMGGSLDRNHESERYSYRRSGDKRENDYSNQNNFKYCKDDYRNYRDQNKYSHSKDEFNYSTSSTHKVDNRESRLSIQSHVGHSFMIDTSVNSSFQRNRSNDDKDNFASRRRRASSVGRTLERHVSKESIRNTEPNKPPINRNIKKDNYRRASSVGREIPHLKNDFNDIKAELKSFKLKSDLKFSDNACKSAKKDESLKLPEELKNEDPRKAKQDTYVRMSSPAQHSPRNNYRDPRMRRESNLAKKDESLKLAEELKNEDPRKAKQDTHVRMSSPAQHSPRNNYRDPRTRTNSKLAKRDESLKLSEELKNEDPREAKQDTSVRRPSSAQYSPRKNNRDPRMRRESRWDSGSNNSQSLSKANKHYGIVYSNDNISKGILGSGVGVKNYKIPKIKRPSVDTDVQATTASDNTRDAKTSILKEIKKSEDTDVAESEIKIEVDTKQSKECTIKSKEGKYDDDSEHKVLKNDQCPESIKPEKTKECSSDNAIENVEKRITRSAKKNLNNDTNEEKESPIKKTRKARKMFIYDSDSNESSKSSDEKDLISKNLSSSKNKTQKTKLVKSANVHKSIDLISEDNDRSVIKEESIEKESNASNKINQSENMSEILNSGVKVNTDNESTKNNKTNNSIDITKEISLGDATKKPNDVEGNERSFDSKIEEPGNGDKSSIQKDDSEFAMDDLEMFPENVSSDPVIDNINALIAELDHDLDVQKTNNRQNEESQKADRIETPPSNESLSNIDNMPGDCQISDHTEPIVSNSSNEKLVQESLDLETTNINTETLEVSKTDPSSLKENLTNVKTSEKDVLSQTHENSCNYDSVVSTTENSQTEETNKPTLTTIINENVVVSTPDSTFNLNNENKKDSYANDQQSLPDSTEGTSSESNTHITSTGNSATIEMESTDTSSTKTEAPKEIDSIEKLLSLLQDRNKMKELISKLGNDSGESEKIKKKLEKLSEIVSDDDEDNKTNCKKERNTTVLEKDSGDAIKTDSKQVQDNEKSLQDKENLPEKGLEEIKTNTCNVSKENEEINLDNKPISNETVLENIQEKSNELSVSDVDDKSENISEPSVINENEDLNNVSINKSLKKRKNKKRGNATNSKKTEGKKYVKKTSGPSRELKNLQDDIREMFDKDDILSATGIRMCRIAKLGNDKNDQKDEVATNDNKPVVVLQKCKNSNDDNIEGSKENISNQRKLSIESTFNPSVDPQKDKLNLSKPGPKSKTKSKVDDVDPYMFETDSVNESNASESKCYSSFESEDESALSKIIDNPQSVSETTKKKRRRGIRGWQSGVIKPKNKKKKVTPSPSIDETSQVSLDSAKIPDMKCFTDVNYCFERNVSIYPCRLCVYTGSDIIQHYKNHHPHSEIPLSRMSPVIASQAIKQCEEVNFQAISKFPSKKYICRFCNRETAKKKFGLEAFFWHVVSSHTGEYKQNCTECTKDEDCPFNLDIPPSPKDAKGQLLGYICGKCNFTQLSLENLKTHVINRHNDEQTEVYTINLSVLSKKAINNYLRHLGRLSAMTDSEKPRRLRSTRSNRSLAETSDEEYSNVDDSLGDQNVDDEKSGDKMSSDEPTAGNLKMKLSFEENMSEQFSMDKEIKTEEIDHQDDSASDMNTVANVEPIPTNTEQPSILETSSESIATSDILDYPHFKVTYTTSGSKEYVCCINGNDNHYKTTLMISLKKHVQIKHSETWDGYCFLCKVIVTPQGAYKFIDCLLHFLDKHIDEFPVLENTPSYNDTVKDTDNAAESSAKSYIAVRPLSELISMNKETQEVAPDTPVLPVIESVVSLGTAKQSMPSPSYPRTENTVVEAEYKYEEAQADIMSKKHSVVLYAMMSHVRLVQIFKCAGKFCSFTTDSAEESLLHASTHMRIGGEYALCCVYCDYDASGNAIDLVTHVFKSHGCCQYVCGLCFYRAAASQLVHAHINRVHKDATNACVLSTTIATGSINDDNCLSREAAVPYYLCSGDGDTANPCKFRTYTPGKFYEHLQTRHPDTTEFACFICSEMCPSSGILRHFKTHGLKLYQCTWCVFGADNEGELLEHASAKHPYKQPKAYLRIITNKEGTTEFRVLPLAHLNKSKVSVTEITPSGAKSDPVREAERAIELEKLIGETTSMIESMSQPVDTEEPQPANTFENINTSAENHLLDSSVTENVALDVAPNLAAILQTESIPPRTKTPTLQTIPPAPEAASVAAVQKIEPVTPEKPKGLINDIVCLDSDDESPPENVIDISTDSPTVAAQPETKRYPLSLLFKCSKCRMFMKTAPGFKRHLKSCFVNVSEPIPCAHCFTRLDKNFLVDHYLNTHLDKYSGREIALVCPVCHLKFDTSHLAKEHFKAVHNQTPAPGQAQEHLATAPDPGPPALTPPAPQETRVRRKRSLGSKDKTVEPPEKVKKYGPQDIHKLPINPILDDNVYCSLCEFGTKVRLNMVRHLQLHAQQQPAPRTAPVNPVPHLETNEKHFDKMLNLASSSIVTRTPEKSGRSDGPSRPAPLIPPEVASRYPKFVPERQRHTCGAKGCSYISVDENMLKCHWETLHSGATDYHCVHCPPYQHLDTSRPLTAARIIAHLKMHDARLYACSQCSYYHYKRQILEKHLKDLHKGGGSVMVVRQEAAAPPAPSPSAPAPAPTMDLKPWQCGVCQFKSLLRAELVEHCAKLHNSKMQFKCSYCAFRTSNLENIPKHQSKSHAGKPEEVFYYYYQVGSLPGESDGVPLWQKQKQKMDALAQIKSEAVDTSIPPQPEQPILKSPAPPTVDLNLVKKEVPDVAEETVEDLCRNFGEFCEPNGLKYKCPLCKNVTEDDMESMQSHLYEELQCRKWGCCICSYKAFHKAGFMEHMQIEHCQNREPLELPVDSRLEAWIAKLLDYQRTIIEKNKENLAKQKAEILRANPVILSVSNRLKELYNANTPPPLVKLGSRPKSQQELEVFGKFGEPVNSLFCCPKCNMTFDQETEMRTHLESELNKIRWFCNNCSQTFQTYHEAQFHCKSVHVGKPSRPVEAPRDPNLRAKWVETAVETQKKASNIVPRNNTRRTVIQRVEASDTQENSLLVVRYEKEVTTPEEQMALQLQKATAEDSDTSITEVSDKNSSIKGCPYCSYISNNAKMLTIHTLRHYDLKPAYCGYCGLNGNKKQLLKHQRICHPNRKDHVLDTVVPVETPEEYLLMKSKGADVEISSSICLVCRKSFPSSQLYYHKHDNYKPDYGKEGDVVVKCCVCSMLHKEVNACLNHHKVCHPEDAVDYVFCKLTPESDISCNVCAQKFSNSSELSAHMKQHSEEIPSTSKQSASDLLLTVNRGIVEGGTKRKMMDSISPVRKVAKKSTSKPSRPFAKKSTTKLPLHDPCEDVYSFYGRERNEDLNETVLIPFCNTMMPITIKKLPEIFGNPIVRVKDLNSE